MMAANIFVRFILTLSIAHYAFSQSSFINVNPSLNANDQSFKADSATPLEINIDVSKVDDYINSIMSCQEILGTGLAIVQLDERNRVVAQYAEGYGRVDGPDESAKVNNRSRFCIGSITKQFTAATLGKNLIERGKAFDTRLIQLLGEDGRFFGRSDYGGLPTVRDILSHRMGIPRYDTAWTVGLEEEREAVWRRLHMLADDYDDDYLAKSYRSSFQYNNWMVTLAGYVLQNITGNTWEQEINSTYFGPLDMTDASFAHESYGPREGFALPAYRLMNDTGDMFWENIDPVFFRDTVKAIAPAGTICLSSEDMLKYLTFLVKDNVNEKMESLKRSIDKTWFEISNPIMLSQISDFSSPKEPYVYEMDEYALCVGRGVYRNYMAVSHGGDVYGYNSYILIFPEIKVGIMVSNSQGFADPVYAQQIALGLFDNVTGGTDTIFTSDFICNMTHPNPMPNRDSKRVQPPAECSKTVDLALEELSGVYRHPVFGDFKVRFNESGYEDGSTLKFDFGQFGHGTLCKYRDEKNNEFQLYFDLDGPFWFMNDKEYSRQLDTMVRFEKDAGGRGVRLVLPMLQKTAPSVQSLTFTKVDYDPCNPSLCTNGGKCVALGDSDYHCQCPEPLKGTNCEIAPITDCSDIKKYYPEKKSGIYQIEIPGMPNEHYNVYCDMDTTPGGWTVIHRRTADKSADNFNSNKSYADYEIGFGKPGKNYNYWMGLAAMRTLADSADKNYTLRIDLTDCQGQGKSVFEEYQNFWLGNASTSYTLHLKSKAATGTAGDALTVSNSYISHNNMPFSTKDHGDTNGCATEYNSGWWFNNCLDANLNGIYYDNCNQNGSATDGIVWLPFHSGKYSMKFASMKIRR